jgi:hypothetical protein
MDYERHIRAGRLCWTLTSNGYKYLTWNLYQSWTKAHPEQPLLVVCADTSAYLFLRREGVPVIMASKRLPDYGPGIITFGTTFFRSLNALKLAILHEFMIDSRIETCIYCDGDIVIYRPFLNDIEERLQTCPLWLQCDEPAAACSEPCPMLCTGLIAARHGVDPLIFRVDDRTLWEKGAGQDQPYVNERIRALSVSAKSLPGDLYPNGARLQMRDGAFLAHYNHMYGNQKIGAMKRRGDWTIAQI